MIFEIERVEILLNFEEKCGAGVVLMVQLETDEDNAMG
jgi:hypothetical protein